MFYEGCNVRRRGLLTYFVTIIGGGKKSFDPLAEPSLSFPPTKQDGRCAVVSRPAPMLLLYCTPDILPTVTSCDTASFTGCAESFGSVGRSTITILWNHTLSLSQNHIRYHTLTQLLVRQYGISDPEIITMYKRPNRKSSSRYIRNCVCENLVRTAIL